MLTIPTAKCTPWKYKKWGTWIHRNVTFDTSVLLYVDVCDSTSMIDRRMLVNVRSIVTPKTGMAVSLMSVENERHFRQHAWKQRKNRIRSNSVPNKHNNGKVSWKNVHWFSKPLNVWIKHVPILNSKFMNDAMTESGFSVSYRVRSIRMLEYRLKPLIVPVLSERLSKNMAVTIITLAITSTAICGYKIWKQLNCILHKRPL